MKEEKVMTSDCRSIAVVDMDGTLVRLNTWKPFATLVVRKALRRGHLLSAAVCATMLLLRKMKRVSHRTVKKHVMLRSRKVLKEKDLRRFASEMAAHFNSEVLALIDEARKGGALVVLATAAAEEYAPLVAEKAEISQTVCTPMAKKGEAYPECRGERKAAEISALSQKLNLPVSLVVTDHPDDFPLFEMFPDARHVLIQPDKK